MPKYILYHSKTNKIYVAEKLNNVLYITTDDDLFCVVDLNGFTMIGYL